MRATMDSRSNDSPAEPVSPMQDTTNLRDEERALGRLLVPQALPLFVRPSALRGQPSTENIPTELRTRPSSLVSSIKCKTSQVFEAVSSSSQKGDAKPLTPRLAALVNAYLGSDITAEIERDMKEVESGQGGARGAGNRDPALLTAHISPDITK